MGHLARFFGSRGFLGASLGVVGGHFGAGGSWALDAFRGLLGASWGYLGALGASLGLLESLVFVLSVCGALGRLWPKCKTFYKHAMNIILFTPRTAQETTKKASWEGLGSVAGLGSSWDVLETIYAPSGVPKRGQKTMMCFYVVDLCL